ncbi:hypothetical protein [Paenibacillus polymyxa]|uniref:Uncharacterized protein n=1 Tax=Paenibacillus polymyxa (strain SC2) TaxID=886882 RepID=E3EJZ2_PAEPS|nr:hypothetical protein [Paenibacillus polymyxa]ADO60011.1 hypothetical protein PPSC2_28135 [Paenibacillus polymyxa SC2]WPQ59772.1 hypothetical protein SKN87_26140 [Paenibacillus polymyxa]
MELKVVLKANINGIEVEAEKPYTVKEDMFLTSELMRFAIENKAYSLKAFNQEGELICVFDGGPSWDTP